MSYLNYCKYSFTANLNNSEVISETDQNHETDNEKSLNFSKDKIDKSRLINRPGSCPEGLPEITDDSKLPQIMVQSKTVDQGTFVLVPSNSF